MRRPAVVVTLDIGGSAAKCTAFDVTAGTVLATRSTSYPVECKLSDPGLFDPEGWWGAAIGALSDLATVLDRSSCDFLGITVTAIRMPFVLVDRTGRPTAPGLLNKDRRAASEVEDIVAAVGADALYDITGHWPAPELGLPKLLWARRTWPDAWSATTGVLQLHDWFIFKLSGVVVSEPSSAGMSQILDVEQSIWSEDLLSALGIPADRFPELRPAGTVLGRVQPEVADATGLPAGLPVHAGGGDTHISALSTGFLDDEVPVIVSGTTAPAQMALRRAPRPAERYPLFLSRGVLVGQWVCESNAGAVGGVIAPLGELGELTGRQLKDALVARGFLVEEHLAGPLTVLAGNPCFHPEGWRHALGPTVTGLDPAHSGADLRAAALEGSCYAIAAILTCLTSRVAPHPPFVVATGGMSTSSAWCQVLADVTGHEVRVRRLEDISGLGGAALVSGEDAATLASRIETRCYRPDPRTATRHIKGRESYERLYERLQNDRLDRGMAVDACVR